MSAERERKDRAFEALIVSAMRKLDDEDVDVERVDEPSEKEKEVLERLGPNFMDELLAGKRGGRREAGHDNDCPARGEPALAGEGVGLYRATEVDEDTVGELDQKDREIVERMRRKQGRELPSEKTPGRRSEAELAAKASEVLRALDMWHLPVDPFEIARKEGIELAPGNYGSEFDGRIKYLSEVDTFSLAYGAARPGRTEGRVRFTVAHELAHFYLHAAYLLGGNFHNSKADFRSRDEMEREADEFAASLLMPRDLFISEVRKYRQGVCVLSELCDLAENRLKTSITSTVRRYCQADIEPCSVVFSEQGHVRWAVHSEDMKRLGMGYVAFGTRVPTKSVTAKIWERVQDVRGSERLEGSVEPSIWYERPWYKKRLWEEAMPLGNTGVVLSYLTLEDPIE